MRVLVALAICLAVAQAATTNFYQPISFQPTNQEPIPVNPILQEISPLPAPQQEYHEINVAHYDGAPLVIIKVNVKKVEQPQVEEPQPEVPQPQVPTFLPGDLVKPAPAFSPADLAKVAQAFNPADLVKPVLEDNAPAVEVPFENEFAPEHMPQAGPLVKIIVNIDN